jgi:hypothetical protein
MNETHIKKLLEEMAELQSAMALIKIEKQKLIDQVITPEIKLKLSAIDDELSEPLEHAAEKITDIEQQIKEHVVQYGASVKGDYLHAVYNKPRVSWNTKGLEGFCVENVYRLLSLKKVGNPSVSIRGVK